MNNEVNEIIEVLKENKYDPTTLSPEQLTILKEAAQPYKTRRKTPEEIEAKARAASHNNEEFAAHVNTTTTRAASRKVTSIVYDRNENIALYAKQRATGICQLCDQPAPFNDADG